MTKKRILLIIITFIIVILVILGSLYFVSHKDNSKLATENENIINTTVDDANTVANNIENNAVVENLENTTDEANNENQEIAETKQESQLSIKDETQSTQASAGTSNNKTNTQKKETVTQTTSQSTATTTVTTPEQPIQQPLTTQPSNTENSKKEETKTETKVERCTNNNNHSLGVGNSNKWFNSKNEAIAYYNQQVKYWGEQWENSKIDNDTYYKNSPSGYEVWDCMYCGKWTINFYYR